MQSGKLRQRIYLERVLQASNSVTNETVYVWEVQSVLWGDTRQLTAKEQSRAGQVKADYSWIVKIRFYSGLTNKHRLHFFDNFGEHILNIVGFTYDNKSKEMEITANEVGEVTNG